jgi:hypothetical protein
MQPTHPPIHYTHHLNTHPLVNDDIRARHSNANRVRATRSRSRSRRALLPRNMQLLRERDGRIVVRQLAARLAVLAGEGNTVVDVEDAV